MSRRKQANPKSLKSNSIFNERFRNYTNLLLKYYLKQHKISDPIDTFLTVHDSNNNIEDDIESKSILFTSINNRKGEQIKYAPASSRWSHSSLASLSKYQNGFSLFEKTYNTKLDLETALNDNTKLASLVFSSTDDLNKDIDDDDASNKLLINNKNVVNLISSEVNKIGTNNTYPKRAKQPSTETLCDQNSTSFLLNGKRYYSEFNFRAMPCLNGFFLIDFFSLTILEKKISVIMFSVQTKADPNFWGTNKIQNCKHYVHIH
jgi:hypothetical protein